MLEHQAINAPSSSRLPVRLSAVADVGLGARRRRSRLRRVVHVKDAQDHIYPPQAMRLAPDMFFQQQIYRADGETLRLPDGSTRS